MSRNKINVILRTAKDHNFSTGLEAGHTYQFRVKALNEEGESEPLDTDHGILAKNPYDVPCAPGLPDIVDWDEKSAKLKWEPPIRDNGAPITGYIIEVMDRDRGEFVKVSFWNFVM